MNRKIIIAAVMVLALITQIGCSSIGTTKETDTTEVTKPAVEEKREDNGAQKVSIEELKELVTKEVGLTAITEWIDINISVASPENASEMLNILEESQKKYLPQVEEAFYTQEMVEKFMKENKSIVDLNQGKDIKDGELAKLLEDARKGGFKVETAEGMYFPVVDYGFYKKYQDNVTEDMKAYIDIMATESDNMPAKDAALVIGWDELLKRVVAQEQFLHTYGDSTKEEDIKQLYSKYVAFSFYGSNNTPLFSYDTKEIDQEAKGAYQEALETDQNSKLLKKLGEFLEVVNQSNGKLTEDVEKFRKDAVDFLKTI